MPAKLPPPPERKKSAEEIAREAVNTAAVAVVASGFTAIDQLAEYLKKKIIEGMSGK